MDRTLNRHSAEDMSARRDRSGTLWLIQAFTGLLLVALVLITAGVHAAIRRVLRETGATRKRRIAILAGTAAWAVLAAPLAGIHGR